MHFLYQHKILDSKILQFAHFLFRSSAGWFRQVNPPLLLASSKFSFDFSGLFLGQFCLEKWLIKPVSYGKWMVAAEERARIAWNTIIAILGNKGFNDYNN